MNCFHPIGGSTRIISLITIALILFIAVLVLFIVFFDKDGTAVYRLVISREKSLLAEKSVSFFEDLQFKDFQKSASYHSPEDQESVDIPKLIERIFLVKPEFIDIMRYRVFSIHVDSVEKRARVFLKVQFRVLNTDKEYEKDIILYYYKDQRDTWFMKLESSLR